jgi:hypothetical protein
VTSDTLSPDSLLIPWTDLPRVLCVSRATLARMKVSGKFGPSILRAGRKLLIRRSELESWVAAGLPDAAGCTKRGAYRAMMQLRDAGRLVLVKRGEPKLGGLATEWRLPG